MEGVRGRGRAALVVFALAVGITQSQAPPPAAAATDTYTGSVAASGPVWGVHRFDVVAGDVITANLDWVDESADLNLFLKDPTGKGVAKATSKTGRPEVVEHVAAVSGTWKLRVKAITGATAYTLTVEEQNDSGDGGDPLVFSGTSDASNSPWSGHRTFLDAGTQLEITLDWDDPAVNVKLFVKDPWGKIVARSTDAAKPKHLILETSSAGSWMVAARAVNGVANYTLTIVKGDAPPPDDPPSDEWPMFAHDPRHTGVSGESELRASTAGDLRVQWQINTGQKAFSSPVVAHDAGLGKTLVYVGNQRGVMNAYDSETGEREWYFAAGKAIQGTAAVAAGVIYFGSSDGKLYALDAGTGSEICSHNTKGVISASPVVANPDGEGLVVYVGDNGISGSDDGGNLWAINAVDPNDATDCSLRWRFDDYGDPPGSEDDAGTWSSPGFGHDKNGNPLVVFGGSSPDNAVYALNATNGAIRWRFETERLGADGDVGAGPTISPPGTNGFVDGAVYIAAKNRILYALNLRTGALYWEFRIRDDSSARGATRSTAALVRDRVYIGYGAGMYSIDAVTGNRVWNSESAGETMLEVLSSPAVSGPKGNEVAFVGDLSGKIYAIRLSDGAVRWSHQTGSFIYPSAAVSDGKVFISSDDGFLYAVGLKPATGLPKTLITEPVEGADLPNPGSDVTVRGTVSDNGGVSRVVVAVKDLNTSKWWNASSQSWTKVYQETEASLSAPGATAANWSLAFPTGFAGGSFAAYAHAFDTAGNREAFVRHVGFSVESRGTPPDTTIDSPIFKQVFHFPDGVRQHFEITISGTATDTAGSSPGVAQVRILIKNLEHQEFYCGSPGCNGDSSPGAHTADFWPTYTSLDVPLDSPGATATTWSYSFMTYDHPHKYRIVAWAIDNDGEQDPTDAVVTRICVRDVGDNTCA